MDGATYKICLSKKEFFSIEVQIEQLNLVITLLTT